MKKTACIYNKYNNKNQIRTKHFRMNIEQYHKILLHSWIWGIMFVFLQTPPNPLETIRHWEFQMSILYAEWR